MELFRLSGSMPDREFVLIAHDRRNDDGSLQGNLQATIGGVASRFKCRIYGSDTNSDFLRVAAQITQHEAVLFADIMHVAKSTKTPVDGKYFEPALAARLKRCFDSMSAESAYGKAARGQYEQMREAAPNIHFTVISGEAYLSQLGHGVAMAREFGNGVKLS